MKHLGPTRHADAIDDSRRLSHASSYGQEIQRLDGLCPIDLLDACDELPCGCLPSRPHGPKCKGITP